MTNGRQHRFALEPGYKLLWYEIDSVLGQGGFGITYLARDTNLNHWVAIKEFLPSDLATRTHDSTVEPISDSHRDTYGWGLQRFVTEAQTLVKFRHPNIVLIHNVFEANNTAYMVMEYVEGRTLEDAFKFKKIAGEAEYKRIILSIMDGLEQIHDAGFIHRDIKPDNIFLRDDGTPVLLDFGSARQAVGGKTRTLTALVSPGYAPYEQYDSSKSGETKQGPWTDVYALGAVLYRAVCGKGPIDAMARVNAAMEGESLFEPVSKTAKGDYSKEFLEAIDWALELRPKRRPQSINEWRKVLTGEHQPDAVTAVADASQAQPVKLPPSSPPDAKAAKPADTSAAPAPAAKTAKHDDTDKADTSPAMELPARKATPGPAAPGPAPMEAEPAKSRGGLVAIAAVVILAAIGGGVYFGGMLPTDSGEVAPVSTAPPVVPEQQAAAVKEDLSPEEAARRRAEEARQKAAELQKQLEAQQQQLEEQKRLVESEAAKLTELEAARKRAERVAQLLAEAESDLEAGRLVQPAKGNAFFRFKEVLALDPENTDAKSGLERVVAGIVGRANAAMEKRAFSEAENLLAEADVVLPGTEVVAKARVDLAKAERAAEEEAERLVAAKKREAEEAARLKVEEQRRAKIKTLLALAEQDLKAGRLVSPEGNNALVRYRDVLKIEPANTAAIIGVEAVVSGLLTLGSEAASKNDFAAASSYLKQAEAIDPKSKQVLEAKTAIARAEQTYELEQKKLAEAERERAEAEQARAEEERKQAVAARAAAAAESGAAEEVNELLAKANNDLKVLRLTSPRGANAFERYKKVLELDPGNSEAEAGILQVGEKYLELKDKALSQNNFDKAEGYLDKAEQVLPGSELVAIARDEYAIARAEFEQARAAQASSAAASQESDQLAEAQAELKRLKAEQEKLKRQMQTQRAPQQTASAAPEPAAAASGKLRVAILPFWGRSQWSAYLDNHDGWLEKLARKQVVREKKLEPVFSTYRDEPPDGVNIKLDRVWSGGGTKVPQATEVARIGTALSVDVVLMIRYRLSGYSSETMSELEVFVFDVASQKAFSFTDEVGSTTTSDREDKAGTIISKALSRYPVGRGQNTAAAGTRATSAPTRVASAAPTESANASTSTESGKLRVAILPFWGKAPWAVYSDDADTWLEALSQKIISRDPNLEIAFSSFTNKGPDGVDIGIERVWQAAGATREPNVNAIDLIARRLAVDAVLLFRYWLSGGYGNYAIRVESFVLDVDKKKLYAHSKDVGMLQAGDRDTSATPVIRAALSEFILGRGQTR